MNVVTVVRSTTRWVEWQVRLFRKFCGVDVFFVNNGPDHAAIQRELDRLGVASHQIEPNTEGNPSISHSIALEWVSRHFLRECDAPLLTVDFDLFPTKPIDLMGVLKGCHAAGQMVCSEQYYHFWPGLMFIGADAPDRAHIGLRAVIVSRDPELRMDSGGETYFWIQQRKPAIRWLINRPMQESDLPEPLRCRYDSQHLFEIKHEAFFHIRGATNWFGLNPELANAREQLAEDYLRYLCG